MRDSNSEMRDFTESESVLTYVHNVHMTTLNLEKPIMILNIADVGDLSIIKMTVNIHNVRARCRV